MLPVDEKEARDVQIVAKSLHVIDKATDFSDFVTIDVEDCGAAFRFFLPLLATTEGKWRLTGTQRNLSRPIKPLIDSLLEVGAGISVDEWTSGEGDKQNSSTSPLALSSIRITGKPLHAEKMRIDCSQSSQFASALLLSSKKLGLQKLEISPTPPPSCNYIRMTEKIIENMDNGEFKYAEIEADWSAALFWYCYVALNPNISCFLPNLKNNSLQGDRIVATWFEQFGVTSQFEERGVKLVNKLTSKQVDEFIGGKVNLFANFDLRNNPDTAPLLAVFAVCAGITLTLTGIQNLNSKESRRTDILVRELSSFAKMEYSEKKGFLKIIPHTCPKNRHLKSKSHNDHRIIMAFSLFALDNTVEFDEVGSVNKSYPSFLNDLSMTDLLSH
jgi:3-phosphoshikimate 1-carboxyvinyltransferase